MSNIWNRRGIAGRFRRRHEDGEPGALADPLSRDRRDERSPRRPILSPPHPPAVAHIATQPDAPAQFDRPVERKRVATILVVSDDPAMIAPIVDVAARHRCDWDLRVVGDADAALARIAEPGGIDILAVQAGGSGRSVAELLDRVRRHSPKTARVAISRADDRDLLLRLIGVAHHYLSMPGDIEQLTGLIEHVRDATDSTLRDPVRAVVGEVDRLPTPPAMFERLAEIMSADDWSIDDLAGEIGRDVALTGKILKLVNSAFYGAAQRVTTVNRAISLLGVDLTRFVVLGNKMFEPADDLGSWIDLNRLARRSNAVAAGARALAIRDRVVTDVSAMAYLAGVVSEIGLLVLGRIPDIDPDLAAPINDATHLGAERAMFGGDRFEVGSHLLTLWGFDEPVVNAVRQLSTDQLPKPGALPWHLVASRRLVVDEGLDPHELASRPGIKADVDEALDRLYDEIDPDADRDALIIANRRVMAH